MKRWTAMRKLIWSRAVLGAAGGGLPSGYKRVIGFKFNDNAYYEIEGLKLKGSDTVKASFSVTAACNVFGCYTTADADNNYSLYASTASSAKYLRYDGGTYSSHFPSSALGEKLDVTITPTGSSGMPTDSTWTQKDFTASTDLCIGTSSTSATSAKMKGNFYGVFEVVGRFYGIPCERESDGALGYYDTKSKTFYEPTVGEPESLGYEV